VFWKVRRKSSLKEFKLMSYPVAWVVKIWPKKQNNFLLGNFQHVQR
jgi:hypothetical protein